MPFELPEGALDAWCRVHLHSAVTHELFQSGYLSHVVGLSLADGREVVLKVRPASPRLDACFQVQEHAFRAGYPCPEPLVPPCPLGGLTASAEAYLPGGTPFPTSATDPALYAPPLARLVAVLSGLGEGLNLEPPLPWLGWAHSEPGLWPTPDDREVNLNDYSEPWLDDVAVRARHRLADDNHPRVIGHGDWYPPNLRWSGDELFTVHDWDSVVQHSEAALAGVAASLFCVLDGATAIDETQAFLDAYEAARGRPLTKDEREIAWAAGLWRLAFDAKKQSVGPPHGLNPQHLREQAEERLRRAGA